MQKITFGKPYIESINGKSRLCCHVSGDNFEEILWYEVDKQFEKYLVYERIDAFVVALIPYIVKNELDVFSDSCISEKLLYQLLNYQLPLMTKYFKKRNLSINCKSDNTNYKGCEVGTGLSGGIDSFYTIAKNIDNTNDYKISYLTFFNVGASGDFGGDKARKLFHDRIKTVDGFAKKNNLGFITVDSNISEFIKMDYVATHTFRSLSAVLALQKMFKVYYYSSGHGFNNSYMNEKDCSNYDVLNMHCLSTEGTLLYCQGIETNRIGKVYEVSKYQPSYDYLNVCVKEDHNCGECEKCMRTLFALDSLGVLDKYKNVFDIEKFRKNKIKNYVFLLKKVYKKNEYYIESYEMYKKRGIHIPIRARLLSFIPDLHDIWFYTPEVIRKRLRKYVKRNEKSN